MIDRAFDIADESMISLLQSECIPMEAEGDFALFSDGAVVTKIDDASEGAIEAFNWLSIRGLAELVTTDTTQYVRLKV